MAGVVGEFKSASRYSLSEVFTLNDRQLRAIQPKIYDEVVIQEENGNLVGYTLEDDFGVDLLEVSDLNWAIIHAFNGTSTISSISKALSTSYKLNIDNTFEEVKRVFFLLVRHSICTPNN